MERAQYEVSLLEAKRKSGPEYRVHKELGMTKEQLERRAERRRNGEDVSSVSCSSDAKGAESSESDDDFGVTAKAPDVESPAS